MPTLDHENNQEHELYVRALKSLAGAGKTSEHTTPATTSREIDFMRETNGAIARKQFQVAYAPGQFDLIFKEEKE